MIADAQKIQWDAETAASTRKTLRRKAAQVRKRQEQEAERKTEYKAARLASRQHHETLTAAIEADDASDVTYAEHLQEAARLAETAKDAETEARREWVAAVAARRKAADELRVAVRRQLEPLPLFDQARCANSRTGDTEDVNNGHHDRSSQEEDLSASAPVETARVPVDNTITMEEICQLHSPRKAKAKKAPAIETCLERVLEQESDADAADPLHHDCPKCHAPAGERCRAVRGRYMGADCAPHRGRGKPPSPVPPKREPEPADIAEAWPADLDVAKVEAAYIAHKLAGSRTPTKPISVKALAWEGRLWVYTGGSGNLYQRVYDLAPLIPVAEFQERYPGFALKLGPQLPHDATDEDRLQYYTGVRVAAGRKEYAIAPAGEQRRLLWEEEQPKE